MPRRPGLRRPARPGASLTGFLEHAAGLHAQEIEPGRGPPHHRLDHPPRQGHRGAAGRAARPARSSCCRPGARCRAPTPRTSTRSGACSTSPPRAPRTGSCSPRCHVRGGRATGGPSRFLAEAGLDHPPGRSPPDPPTPKEHTHAHPRHPTAPPSRPRAPTPKAAELFRRPFAPGAIGFRAMSKVAYNGDPAAARRSPPTSAPSRSCSG